MTDKKVDKAADVAVKDTVVKVKKAAETVAASEKGAPPAPVETKSKEKLVIPDFGKYHGSSRMRKAVEDARKSGLSVTPVEKIKGPTVVISGMSISPVATGLKPTGSSGDTYTHDGKEFWLPGHLLYNAHTRQGVLEDEPWIRTSSYQGPEMSLFAFVYDNDTFWLLMDENSTFIRDADSFYCRTKGGHLIMINSASHNDQFIGNNVLVNVESHDNILNQTNIIVNSARVGQERGWGDSSPFKVGSKRQVYKHLRMKKVDAIDSELTRGRYFSSNFTKSTVEGTGTYESSVESTFLTECRIRGSRVLLTGLTGEALNFDAEGEILVKGVGNLKHQHWSFPSIHVTNRFAFTEIDHITRHDRGIKMVRISPTEVEVGLAMWKDGVKVTINAPRFTVENAILDGLRDSRDKKPEPAPAPVGPFGAYIPPYQSLGPRSYYGEKPGETIRNFMDNYIVDQVVSRLGVIQMLDEVESTAKDLDRTHPHDHINFLE